MRISIHRRLAAVVAGAVILAGSLTPVLAQDPLPLEEVCRNAGGFWTETDATCTVAARVEINIDYPVRFAQYGFAREAIDSTINLYRMEVAGLVNDVGFPFGQEGVTYSLSVSSDEFAHSADIASLLLTMSTYTGGAHPNSFYAAFTVDLANETLLTFDDVFPPETNPLDTLVPLIRASLTEQLGDAADAAWIESGTADANSLRNFVLTADSVIFYFEPYQVTAYAAGPQQVEIPLADLAAILAPLS